MNAHFDTLGRRNTEAPARYSSAIRVEPDDTMLNGEACGRIGAASNKLFDLIEAEFRRAERENRQFDADDKAAIIDLQMATVAASAVMERAVRHADEHTEDRYREHDAAADRADARWGDLA